MILSVGTRCRKSKFSCYQLISLVVFIPYLPMNVCLPCIWIYNDIGIDIDIDIGNIIMNSTSIQRKTARKIDQNKREIWTEKQKNGKRRRERRKKRRPIQRERRKRREGKPGMILPILSHGDVWSRFILGTYTYNCTCIFMVTMLGTTWLVRICFFDYEVQSKSFKHKYEAFVSSWPCINICR